MDHLNSGKARDQKEVFIHFEMDSSKAKKLLSWKPKHSLRDTLTKMVENLKANPKKFYQVNNLNK